MELFLAEKIAAHLKEPEAGLCELVQIPALALRNRSAFLPYRDDLMIVSDYRQIMPSGFHGEFFDLPDGCCGMLCPLDEENLTALQNILEYLRPRKIRGELSFHCFCPEKMPLFRVESAEELHAVTLRIFREGWKNGFAVTSSSLSGERILPLWIPQESAMQPDHRQNSDYAGHTFVLKSGVLEFPESAVACCVKRYGSVLNCITRCRKSSVVLLPDGITPEELLFFNRELWLMQAELPVLLLQSRTVSTALDAVNQTYGKAQLLSTE